MATAGVSSVGDLVGGIFSHYSQKSLMKQQFNYTNQLIDKQNEYNKPVNQMARLEEAGLNPYVLAGSFNAGNQSSSGSTPTPSTPAGAEQIGRGLGSFMQNYLAAKQATANINKTEADKLLVETEISKKQQDIKESQAREANLRQTNQIQQFLTDNGYYSSQVDYKYYEALKQKTDYHLADMSYQQFVDTYRSTIDRINRENKATIDYLNLQWSPDGQVSFEIDGKKYSLDEAVEAKIPIAFRLKNSLQQADQIYKNLVKSGRLTDAHTARTLQATGLDYVQAEQQNAINKQLISQMIIKTKQAGLDYVQSEELIGSVIQYSNAHAFNEQQRSQLLAGSIITTALQNESLGIHNKFQTYNEVVGSIRNTVGIVGDLVGVGKDGINASQSLTPDNTPKNGYIISY